MQLRHGPVYQCALYGGFGVLDEINMAKNEAAAVLHAVLDQRRILEVPGYDKVSLDPAARFIATMNYGYAGTKELNEALVSRFLVIDMPEPDKETLERIIAIASRISGRRHWYSLSACSWIFRRRLQMERLRRRCWIFAVCSARSARSVPALRRSLRFAWALRIRHLICLRRSW